MSANVSRISSEKNHLPVVIFMLALFGFRELDTRLLHPLRNAGFGTVFVGTDPDAAKMNMCTFAVFSNAFFVSVNCNRQRDEIFGILLL
jgi:hypothetical protein